MNSERTLNFYETDQPDQVLVEAECIFCHKIVQFIAPLQGLKDWANGKVCQEALPELTADQREMLISGICGQCWDSEVNLAY